MASPALVVWRPELLLHALGSLLLVRVLVLVCWVALVAATLEPFGLTDAAAAIDVAVLLLAPLVDGSTDKWARQGCRSLDKLRQSSGDGLLSGCSGLAGCSGFSCTLAALQPLRRSAHSHDRR